MIGTMGSVGTLSANKQDGPPATYANKFTDDVIILV